MVYVTTQEDAKLEFQIDEAQSRKDYSAALATAEKTRALGVSAITHSSTLTSAGLQEAVDAAFANAEEIYWTAEAGVRPVQK